MQRTKFQANPLITLYNTHFSRLFFYEYIHYRLNFFLCYVTNPVNVCHAANTQNLSFPSS